MPAAFMAPHDAPWYVLVMEVATETVADVIAGGKPMGTYQLKDMLQSVAQGLLCLHMKDLVHCDIKPDNIMNCVGSKRWVLADLDCCTAVGSPPPPACTGAVAPPEMVEWVVEGTPFTLDTSYDVWQFGALVYAAATGESLFGREGSDLRAAAAAGSLGRPRAPPTAVMKALHKRNSRIASLMAATMCVNPGERRGMVSCEGKMGVLSSALFGGNTTYHNIMLAQQAGASAMQRDIAAKVNKLLRAAAEAAKAEEADE